ncbi:hypothetical protein AbraIFM66950_010373 [Aspergillus brasiliensis]|nr:hypothetical protein AbraIFM66950_010373 [Aspergillus brasiliensis]
MSSSARPSLSNRDGMYSPVDKERAEARTDTIAQTTRAKSPVLDWWGHDVEWLMFDEPNDIALDETERYQRQQLLLELGDYAGRIFNLLREAASALGYRLPTRVGQLKDKISEEIRVSSEEPGPYIKIIGDSISYLQENGLDVDLQMVRLAILVYNKRNRVCHARVGDPEIASQPGLLNGVIRSDKNRLRQILPNSHLSYCTTWYKIMDTYGASQGKDIVKLVPKSDDTPTLPGPDFKRLHVNVRSRTFHKRVFGDRIRSLVRTDEDRKPMTPYQSLARHHSDPTPYTSFKRTASGCPITEGGIKSTGGRLPPAVAFGEAADARTFQDLYGDLVDLFDKDAGRARKALQDARRVVSKALTDRKAEEREEGRAAKKQRREGRVAQRREGA